MQAGLGAGRVPRAQLAEPSSMTCVHEQDVARPDDDALIALGRVEIVAEYVLAGLEPALAARAGCRAARRVR
jgi:hypothetical protein